MDNGQLYDPVANYTKVSLGDCKFNSYEGAGSLFIVNLSLISLRTSESSVSAWHSELEETYYPKRVL